MTPLPATWLPGALSTPDWLFRALGNRMLAIDPLARSSMWDDLEAGRVTEIDAICGAVVRLAAQHGAQAPLSGRMCELLSGPRLRLTGAEMTRAVGLG